MNPWIYNPFGQQMAAGVFVLCLFQAEHTTLWFLAEELVATYSHSPGK